jgi:hypothetical protein
MSGGCKPVHNDELSRRATLTLFSWVAGSLVFVPRRSGIEEKITVFLATRWTPTSERSFQASFQSMHPNLVGVLVSVGIILLLFSGELSRTPWRRLSREEVLPSAAENGAASSAGLLQGKIRRAVMLYASSADG